MDQPRFPLAEYPLPVRTMAVQCMKPDQIINYAMSSPTAAAVVRDSNIHIELFRFEQKRPDRFEVSIGLPGHQDGWFLWRFSAEEIEDDDLIPIHLADGDVLEENCQNMLCEIHTKITKNNAKSRIAKVLRHLTTVFPLNGRERFHIRRGCCAPFLKMFPTAGRKLCASEVRFEREWAVERFESVVDCFRTIDHVHFPFISNPEILPMLIPLTPSKIEIETESDDFPFEFIVNKWTKDEAFQNLKSLILTTSRKVYVEQKRYLRGIEGTQCHPNKRPKYLCEFGEDKVESFVKIGNAADVFRTDGTIGTVYVKKNGSRNDIVFRVWTREELINTDKEDQKTIKRMIFEKGEKIMEKVKALEELTLKMWELRSQMDEISNALLSNEMDKNRMQDCLKQYESGDRIN